MGTNTYDPRIEAADLFLKLTTGRQDAAAKMLHVLHRLGGKATDVQICRGMPLPSSRFGAVMQDARLAIGMSGGEIAWVPSDGTYTLRATPEEMAAWMQFNIRYMNTRKGNVRRAAHNYNNRMGVVDPAAADYVRDVEAI